MINLGRVPRPLLSLALLGAGALLWFLNQSSEQTPLAAANDAEHVPSYYVRDLVMHEYGPDGNLSRFVETPRLTEYLDDQTTEMETPYYVFHRQDQPPWHVRSEHGWLSADGQLALLSGRVTMTRDGTADSLPIKMVTSEVRIQPQNNYLETDNHVKIDSGDDIITATGMQAWLATPSRVKFLNQVRSTYVPRK